MKTSTIQPFFFNTFRIAALRLDLYSSLLSAIQKQYCPDALIREKPPN